MLGLKWILIAAGVVVLLFLKIRQYWQQRQEKLQRRSKVESLAADPSLALQTIFVSVPCYSVRQCAATLLSLFDQSACPGRIFVGVCHVLDKHNQDSLPNLSNELENLVKQTGKTGWNLIQEHVRICNLALSDTGGDAWVRAYMETMLYRGEKYYLSLDNDAQMVEDWDLLACSQLQQCPSDYSVLVCCSSAVSSSNPLFLVATDASPMSVQLLPKVMEAEPSRPVPSLFCSASFNFCLAERLKDTPTATHYLWPTQSEQATDLSIRLWTSGWDFYAPCKPLCKGACMVDSDTGVDNQASLFQMQLGKFRSLPQYQEFCGVDFRAGQLSGRAKLGVTDDAPASEILAKYGSMTTFAYHKALATA